MGIFIWNLQITFILFYDVAIVQGSIKKGVAVGPKSFLCDDFKALDNVAWWYDWGANLDKIRTNSGCANVDQYVNKHVPMTWGYGRYFSNYYLYDEAEFLLGFNEPNHIAQSNIAPKDAAKYWKEVEALADGRPLVSPAAAPCNGSGCNANIKEWFDQFFGNCTDCRVDYIATHVYSCSANKTMEFLKLLYKEYNLTIWLTEFACPRKNNIQRQLEYMQELLPQLEAAPYIFRYSWYVHRVTDETATDFIPTAVSLLEPNSSNLTVLGRFYNSFTSTETSTSTTGITVDNSTTKMTIDSNMTTASTAYNSTTASLSYTMSTESRYDNTTTFTYYSTEVYTDIYVSSANIKTISDGIFVLIMCIILLRLLYNNNT